jgi:TPR repeat protein
MSMAAHIMRNNTQTGYLPMIDYSASDAPIDLLIWQGIEGSPCPEDFQNYLRHSPEGAAHLDDAIERLIELDDADAVCANDESRYPAVIAAIKKLAEAGDAVAQFHMGKLHDIGIGIEVNINRAEGWYRLAILQGELRSHINLALGLEKRGKPEDIDEMKRLLATASAANEDAGAFNLARMINRGYGEVDERPNPASAFELFHQSWEQGSALAAYWIGYMLLQGNGVRQDSVLGRDWIVRSARAGCIGAIIKLGGDAEYGSGCEKDPSAAVEWFRQGAELGSMECQHRLAGLLLRGEGIAKDGAQAVQWLKRAAVRGNADAQRVLGLAYLWGIDVIRNIRFGRKWLTRAAEQDDAYAAYQLGKHLQNAEPPELESAAQWFERAAKLGDSTAQSVLGACYWNGHGVVADDHAAFKWIKLSSMQGDSHGLYLLGRLYYSGVDVPVDLKHAAKYFRQSAERGHSGGQAKLGWCYLKGQGVDRDVAEGMLWLSRAAERDDGEASTIIGYVLRDGIGVQRNSGEASKWFLSAAEKGDARGQFELAWLYAEGDGLERNLVEATKWMEKAAAQGEEDAVKWLADQVARANIEIL